MDVTDITQQVRKVQVIHRVGCVLWMRPEEKDAVLRAVCDRPEGVWLPGRDLLGWIRRRPDGVGTGVPIRGADAASEDL
jgi:hypothetical protein